MKKGMTPEAVEQMATTISDAGENAFQIFETVFGRVEGLDWTGDDRDRFLGEFESIRGQIQQAKQQAEDFAERARTNATQQRNASS